MIVPPGQVLDDARAAAKAENHALALENYERFFDRALLDQGEDHNYYGVRLSYCLHEWARLGEKYPAARERLEAKAVEALAAFEATGDSEKFHDFQSIRENLGQEESVLSQFIQYHKSKPDLASQALRLMWNRLVEAKRWDICSAYLHDFESKYESALFRFDQTMQICVSDSTFGGNEFAEQIKGWYVRDVGNLIGALRNSGWHDAAKKLEAEAASDMQSRGHPELASRVLEQAAL
ncbi:hypothetical protein [Uliginosibacterium sp. TH139]|uniref:hypothetical protein n=1 Tax=Uliginosibacterium sp. TH139 TaxID=2067453 RepID=UPI000C7DBA93|nr:hypothetical protein [Uliginosibacterium sp. TH139]PLK47808.1 hypothetical protein C0V76_15695 [Uliginosibacterium sp. TH139]